MDGQWLLLIDELPVFVSNLLGLRRLAIAIRNDAALAATWLPLGSPEEQYNIGPRCPLAE